MGKTQEDYEACPYCTIAHCPFLVISQCPVKALWDRVEEMEQIARQLDNRHIVNLGSIGNN